MNNFDKTHIWHPYTLVPNPISTYQVESAEGVFLTLKNHGKVVDGMSSWWAVIHGYNHPVLNQAIQMQLDKMSHVMFGGLTHQPAIALAKTLVELTPKPLEKVFFADSGSVAVEVALKMALQYWQNQACPKKCKFVALKGGYHGDTFGAMSVCDPEQGMHHLFTDNLTQNFFAKSPAVVGLDEALADLKALLEKESDCIAAMILEPVIQGAGGMRIYNPQYLLRAKALCEAHKVLFILDEIATGFGRTGELFAFEYVGVVPDILCLGKALTGGYLSLGAVLTSDKVASNVGALMHGPTFMANPLSCAVANASIDLLLNAPWQDNIAKIERIFYQELPSLSSNKKVKEVRILGAIAVVEMMHEIEVENVQKILIECGVWLRPFGKLLYTMPPFIISEPELLKITQAIKTVVEKTP
jgi:adenosylmethionine-8-amino-7-oxononanoate aminotransferase